MTERIYVVGLGLIGGSIALGLQKHDYEVTGWDLDQAVNEKALERDVVEGIMPPSEIQANLNGIIVAVPVPKIPSVVDQLPEDVSTDFITDVGSTKQWVMDRVSGNLPGEVDFVGAHPMAGSEESGLGASDPLLFENAICVVTPDREESDAVEKVTNLWDDLGAHVMIMDPLRHDRVAARVSHLPHVAAAGLVHAVEQLDGYEDDALPLAAGGFRDTTRIADGDPELWRDIIESNKKRILDTLSGYETSLEELKSALSNEDWDRLEAWLGEARSIRAKIPEKAKGMIGQLFELRIQAPDRPGILADVTGILAEASINICDIEVLRVREGELGTIRLAFRRREERESARELLENQGKDIDII